MPGGIDAGGEGGMRGFRIKKDGDGVYGMEGTGTVDGHRLAYWRGFGGGSRCRPFAARGAARAVGQTAAPLLGVGRDSVPGLPLPHRPSAQDHRPSAALKLQTSGHETSAKYWL